MVIRRLGFGLWAADIIAAMAIGVVIIIAIAVAETHAGSGNAMLRYASHSQSSLISMTQRIIADTGWPGTGAGTFAMLLPIYGDSSTSTVGMPAPTTAAQIAIELGRPALWAILIMTMVVLISAVTRRAATWPGFVLSGRRSRLYRRFDARGILRRQSFQHCSPHLHGGRFRPRPCPAGKSHDPMTGDDAGAVRAIFAVVSARRKARGSYKG